MGDYPRCSGCGTKVPAASPGGLCPSCLLGLALSSGEDEDAVEREAEPGLLPGPVYRVLGILSSGEDRTTYLAEQEEPRRMVTLDVVMLGDREGAADACRRRVQALERLDHPSIARVLEGRVMPSGDFCVVARHATGQPLDRFCETKRLPPSERARLFSEVCRIVADVHARGVCHGRLGPSAVVVSEGGPGRPALTLVGFTVTPGREPTVEDDAAGLASLARAAGWRGGQAGTAAWPSLDALRTAATGGWE